MDANRVFAISNSIVFYEIVSDIDSIEAWYNLSFVQRIICIQFLLGPVLASVCCATIKWLGELPFTIETIQSWNSKPVYMTFVCLVQESNDMLQLFFGFVDFYLHFWTLVGTNREKLLNDKLMTVASVSFFNNFFENLLL